MWHSHFNSCLLLPEPHVFEVYMCLHVIKFSLHGCRYMVCLTLKLCWALEMVSDAVRRQSKRGFNYKDFCNFFKKNSGQYRPSLYEGVFGPSLTSLFDVSKPLPLFMIDIYTLHQYCGMIHVSFYISVVWITTSWVLLAFGGVILVILIQGAWWHEWCRQGAKCMCQSTSHM